jgi:enoyl-CoA hydratase
MADMNDFVRYEQHDGIAMLNMDDQKANAYGPGMIQALSEGLDRAELEAQVAVIKGRPGVFCAGFDLKIIRGDDEQARVDMRSAGEALLLKAYVHPQPLIMACTGHALAAGALLMLTGDYRIGVIGEFSIGLNETAIGLSLPPFGLELARDRLDPRALSNATVGATLCDPQAAVEVGYLDSAVESQSFDDAVVDMANRLSALDVAAYAETKRRLRRATIERIRTASE